MKLLSEETALELTEKLLENDKTIKDGIPSIVGLATENFVTSEIAKAQLSGGEVDLSGYLDKDTFDKTMVDYSTTAEIEKMVDEKITELDTDFETSDIDFSTEY